MIKTLTVQVDIDLDDYETNYGTRDETEAANYTEAFAQEALTAAFDRVGGWATIVGDGVSLR